MSPHRVMTIMDTMADGPSMAHPDPWGLNVDLHCHSTVSDGTQTPGAVVQRAARNGVQLLALTDHDELDGLSEAMAEAQRVGLRLVCGVEVSVTWAGETIHVVGLRIDPSNVELEQGLRTTRAGRRQRAIDMGRSLEAAGIPGVYEGALRYVSNPDLISRSHFARYLVSTGVRASTSEVFRSFLTPGNPGYVPLQWAALSDALGWIRAAGGTAVLAHPARYRRFDETRLWALAEAFRDCGGQGIEVLSGNHSPADVERFGQWSVRLGLRASRGSDFHDPDESAYDLGGLPPLPRRLTPIWADWPEIEGLERRFETN